MRNIYLTGFMGTGKSTVSRYLHKNYGLKQLEMDEEIVRQEGRSIADIFAQEGEEYFRTVETKLLDCIGNDQNLVVSCGGGTATRQCNVQKMKKNGIIILLSASPKTVYERVKDNHDRPLLEGNMNVAYIAGLMEKRKAAYEAAADFTVVTDGRSAQEICQEIMEKVM